MIARKQALRLSTCLGALCEFNLLGSISPRSLLRKELFRDLLESVIPECFYPSISLGTVRFSNRRESRRDRNWTPDYRHSGVTPSSLLRDGLIILVSKP